MQPNPKQIMFYPDYQDALVLDVEVLEKLLVVNRAAQGRTKYYQRLDMCCRCIRRKGLHRLFEFYENLSVEISDSIEQEMNRRKREQVFWEFTSKKNVTGSETNEEGMPLLVKLMKIRKHLESDIPEAVSRIEHASEALFKEIGQGFFLPFCSACAAAVARIRFLLLRLGSEILHTWPNWHAALVKCFGKRVNSSLRWDPTSFGKLQKSFNPPQEKECKEVSHKPTNLLLRDLGFLIDKNKKLPPPNRKDAGSVLQNQQQESKRTTYDLDFGQPLTSITDADGDKFVPDYMEDAVSKVQKKLAWSKKANAGSLSLASPSNTKSKPSTLQTASDSPVTDTTELTPTTGDEKPTITEDSSQRPQKRKKKRKEASISKGSKKAKSSDDFFDKLFR